MVTVYVLIKLLEKAQHFAHFEHSIVAVDWMPFVAVEGTAVEIDAAVGIVVVVVAVVEGVVDTAAVAVVDTEPVAVHFEYTVGFVVVVAGTEAAVIDLVCTAAVVAVVSIAAEVVAVVHLCKAEAEAAVDTVAAAAAASKTAVVQALLGTASADLSRDLEVFGRESVLDSDVAGIQPGTVCCQQSVQQDWHHVLGSCVLYLIGL